MTDILWAILGGISSFVICLGHIKDRFPLFFLGYTGLFFSLGRMTRSPVKGMTLSFCFFTMIIVFNYRNISAYRRNRNPKIFWIVIAVNSLVLIFLLALGFMVYKAGMVTGT